MRLGRIFGIDIHAKIELAGFEAVLHGAAKLPVLGTWLVIAEILYQRTVFFEK
jgi:hypothetical protein